MSTETIVTLAIAGYGAILSTILALIEYRRRKPEIKLRLYEIVEPTPPPDVVSSCGGAKLIVTTMNTGERPVFVYRCCLLEPKTKNLMDDYSGPTLPHELPSGQKCVFRYDRHSIAKWLKSHGVRGKTKLIATCADGMNNTYRSKPHVFDLD